MATTGERRADAERNIAAILDAAADLMAERPQVPMAEVARAAGVVRATLYGHFPSRDDLMVAVLDRALTEAIAAIDAARPDDGPAPDALARLVSAAWPVLVRHHRLGEAAADALGADAVRRHHAPLLDRVRGVIERGQDEGAFRTDLAADWLVAAFYGLAHTARDEMVAGRLTGDQASEALVKTLHSALS